MTKRLSIASVVWALICFSYLFFCRELINLLWVLGYLIRFPILLALLILIILAIRHIYKYRYKARSFLPLLFLMVASISMYYLEHPISFEGEHTCNYLRLMIHKSAYDDIIAHHTPSSSSDFRWKNFNGIEYVVDPGPPVRIAFSLPGGILDNWSAIVYDPTGMVMESNKFRKDWSNWDDPSLSLVKRLFRGDMYYAYHLKGNYYVCYFT